MIEEQSAISQSQPCADAKSARTEVETSAAEWAVVTSTWRPYAAVGPISKQTPLRIYYPKKYGRGDEFTDLGATVYRGAQEDCEKLAAQLLSSRSLAEEERRQSYVRHREREAKLIAEAPSQAGTARQNGTNPGRHTVPSIQTEEVKL